MSSTSSSRPGHPVESLAAVVDAMRQALAQGKTGADVAESTRRQLIERARSSGK